MPADVIRITDAESGATADVSLARGFNCFSWVSPFAGEADASPRELLWSEEGFVDGGGSASRSGIPLLAPFPGRIANATYEWNGKRYDLEPTAGNEHAIHGFAARKPWRLVSQTAHSVTGEFRPSIDDPAAVPQWPSDYRIEATYTIEGSRLAFALRVENLGDEPMPFGFATHAYFRLPLAEGSDPESTVVIAPVDGEWVSDELIPTGEINELPSDHELPAGAALSGRQFDTPYRFAEGAKQTDLIDPVSRRRVRQTFDSSMKCCVIYTPDHREAICLEPYTCTPDPIAMGKKGVDSGLITLEQGEAYNTRLVLEASTPEV